MTLTPKDQALVLTALHQAGVAENLPFDRYKEQVNYSD